MALCKPGVGFGDDVEVPARAVLVLEQHELAEPIDPRARARVVIELEGEQPLGFSARGQLVDHLARQPNGLGDEVDARHVRGATGEVALVEDQVEHPQQRVHALVEVGRNRERHARLTNLALGPHDALRERGLGQQVGGRDFGGGQSARQSQGQCHLRVTVERRMAAEQEQPEAFVAERRSIHDQVVLLVAFRSVVWCAVSSGAASCSRRRDARSRRTWSISVLRATV